MAGGLLALPATMPAASASVRPGIYPCTLTANYPRESSSVVGASGSLSCSGEDTIYVTVCLEQLVTGGWQQVVGSCSTSPTVYSTYISTAGKSYVATCGRYYRTRASGYDDGDTGTVVSSGYQGCT